MTSGSGRARRRDAEANRARILDTARMTFASEGLEIPLLRIATDAGVGIATLFRNFVGRDELVATVYSEPIERCATTLDAAVDRGADPWETLSEALRGVCALQVEDFGFAAVLVDVFHSDVRFEASRRSMESSLQRLLTRAAEEGAVRPELQLADIALMIYANGAIVASRQLDASTLSQQLVEALLRSFRDNPAPKLTE